ncbi:MAG TPA: SEC-C metal-binding domain-containing protein [Myxococcota bacterium]|nr:SEC-C metal-binding domain-containing protein [Myxococcota bacterium]
MRHPYRRYVWQSPATRISAFERTSKRRHGYPSETHVKRGDRTVHGDKELVERLGRRDLCPCGSGRRFQAVLPPERRLRRRAA